MTQDAQSTIAGLKAQDCPGGGWNGMPPDLERATVADCLSNGVCGCIHGAAVLHIEQLTDTAAFLDRLADGPLDAVPIMMKNQDRRPNEEKIYDALRIAAADCRAMAAKLRGET